MSGGINQQLRTVVRGKEPNMVSREGQGKIDSTRGKVRGAPHPAELVSEKRTVNGAGSSPGGNHRGDEKTEVTSNQGKQGANWQEGTGVA